jgi:hypothetical protein
MQMQIKELAQCQIRATQRSSSFGMTPMPKQKVNMKNKCKDRSLLKQNRKKQEIMGFYPAIGNKRLMKAFNHS